LPKPLKVVRSRRARNTWEILVQWDGLPSSDATWERVADFQIKYPDFQLEDELFAKEGRDVMWGKTYTRKSTAAEG
jgi:hypothetical protein